MGSALAAYAELRRGLDWRGESTAHRLLGWAAFAGAAFLGLLPARLAYALADLTVPAIVFATWRHERRVAGEGRGLLRNLRIAYRDRLDARRARRILLGWSRHVARLFVDYARLPRAGIGRDLDARAVDELAEILKENRGLLCVSGHIGMWELCGHASRRLGRPMTFVARPLSPRPLDDVVNALRRTGGHAVLSKWSGVNTVRRELERGHAVGLLVDEDTPHKPVFAPFLGTAAATNRTPALLHRLTGAPIAVVTCERTSVFRFRIHVWRVIRHAPSADREGDLRCVTAQINDALSRAILATPEQWLWGSRRFRTRPPHEAPGADGLPPRSAPLPDGCARA